MKRNAFTPLEINSSDRRRVSLMGFTFIELIVSITIFTIVIIAIYSAFNLGIKTWRRSEEERSLQKVRLALLKVEKELKESFFFSGIPFSGTDKEMVFPLTIPAGDRDRACIITYSVNIDSRAGLKKLVRKERDFSEDIEEAKEKIKKVSPLVNEIKFAYAYKAEGPSKDFEWQAFWDGKEKGALPSGVRISLATDEGGGFYNKMIFLPHGKLGEK